ncbi:hypothetical protein EBB07_14155 [Paenibacillaceae bacterium]|nr:hypothetical protein EBB07_14155 [Paenibacillaceae bacterium]
MITMHLIIGEHTLQVHTESEVIQQLLLQKFKLASQPSSSCDLHVTISGGYGSEFTGYEVEAAADRGQVNFTRTDYRIVADSDFTSATIEVYDSFALKHALMNLYSALIVNRKWGLLIHSSCIAEEGKAYLFAGQSGAGKSTVARLSQPRPILSDEATIVKVTNAGAFIYDSPFRSELEEPFNGEACPLAAIQLLRQSMENKRSPLPRMDGLLQLLDKVFYWVYEKEETAKVFGMCQLLVRAVPMYELYFQKNNTFWKEIS